MSYPAGIKQLITVKIKRKNILTLNEKRTLLLKIRFKCRKVHLGGIGLDLTEIGIYSGIQGKVVRQAYLGIQSAAGSKANPFETAQRQSPERPL